MTKIDDEMVERALEEFWTGTERLKPDSAVRQALKRTARKALEAALSPKPEPEIEVTPAMATAGVQAFDACAKFESSVAAMYRAMESTRLKEAKEWANKDGHVQGDAAYAAKSALQGASAGAPVKETGGGVLGTLHARNGEKKAHQHRRKDDATYVSFFSLDRA